MTYPLRCLLSISTLGGQNTTLAFLPLHSCFSQVLSVSVNGIIILLSLLDLRHSNHSSHTSFPFLLTFIHLVLADWFLNCIPNLATSSHWHCSNPHLHHCPVSAGPLCLPTGPTTPLFTLFQSFPWKVDRVIILKCSSKSEQQTLCLKSLEIRMDPNSFPRPARLILKPCLLHCLCFVHSLPSFSGSQTPNLYLLLICGICCALCLKYFPPKPLYGRILVIQAPT